jgi:6-phosphogluconolactonase (cycloisomerase 2 family)
MRLTRSTLLLCCFLLFHAACGSGKGGSATGGAGGHDAGTAGVGAGGQSGSAGTALGSGGTSGGAPGQDGGDASTDASGLPEGGGQGFAYAVNQSGATVSQLSIGSSGALAPLTPSSVPCEMRANSLAVDPSGKYLYVVNERGATGASYGSISQYTIGADGTLAPMTPATIAADYGPGDVAVHPSGKYVYAITYDYPLGGTKVTSMAQYTIGADGTLTPMSPGAVAITGSNPQFIAIHPSGNFLYVSDGSGVVDQFTIDATTGALSAMTPATAPFPFPTAGHTAFAITVHPSGKWAYVTDYYGGIAEYTIDATTGALSPLAQTKAVGTMFQCAAWIAVDPSGKYAYTANCASTAEAISQFTVGADGTLAAMTPASVAGASAGTNIQVDASGTHLYMTSGTSGAGDVVLQYSISASGALAPMTPATVTVGGSPNALVLVKR